MGARNLELADNAQVSRERPPARDQRCPRILVLSNCSWENGEVVAALRQLFDLLAKTTAIAARQEAGNMATSPKNEIWLGD